MPYKLVFYNVDICNILIQKTLRTIDQTVYEISALEVEECYVINCFLNIKKLFMTSCTYIIITRIFCQDTHLKIASANNLFR